VCQQQHPLLLLLLPLLLLLLLLLSPAPLRLVQQTPAEVMQLQQHRPLLLLLVTRSLIPHHLGAQQPVSCTP
jgi:hypothetical protein